MRKGDISINMIIIASIGLLVLVVVSLVFMSRSAVFSKGAADCSNFEGYKCAPSADTCPEGYKYASGYSCYETSGVSRKVSETNPACCVQKSEFQ